MCVHAHSYFWICFQQVSKPTYASGSLGQLLRLGCSPFLHSPKQNFQRKCPNTCTKETISVIMIFSWAPIYDQEFGNHCLRDSWTSSSATLWPPFNPTKVRKGRDTQGEAFCTTSENLPTAITCPKLMSKQEKWEKPTKTKISLSKEDPLASPPKVTHSLIPFSHWLILPGHFASSERRRAPCQACQHSGLLGFLADAGSREKQNWSFCILMLSPLVDVYNSLGPSPFAKCPKSGVPGVISIYA